VFGHAVKVFYKDLFDKHGKTFAELGVNVNNGFANVLEKIKALPEAKRKEIEADIKACEAKRPRLSMVDSAKGISNLYNPNDIIVDEPVSFPSGNGMMYQPGNYDRTFRGPVTLRYALQQSINIPAVKLLRKVGVSLVASYARRMGIRNPVGQNLSMALGTSEVTLLELTAAYGVFADRGIRNDPLYILKVEDKAGNVIERNSPRPVEVLSEETAAIMTSMLQDAVDHGTGYPARLRGFLNPAAGKTGTMDDYMDAWFVGYTPSLVAGCWVGFDEKRTIGQGMTGARAALPAWTDFMMGATRGRPVESFEPPTGSAPISNSLCFDIGSSITACILSLSRRTLSCGVSRGAKMPNHALISHPGSPASAEVGTSGSPESRRFAPTARGLICPLLR